VEPPYAGNKGQEDELAMVIPVGQSPYSQSWYMLQVHAIHQNGSPTEDLCHPELAPARAPEAQPIPTSQTAQQKSSNSSNQGPDSKSGMDSHSEEHEQAINTLSALWPSDVPIDRAFLESLLGIQCQGNLEVFPPPFLLLRRA